MLVPVFNAPIRQRRKQAGVAHVDQPPRATQAAGSAAGQRGAQLLTEADACRC